MPKISTSLLNESVTIQRLTGSSVDDRGLSTATFDETTNGQARIIRNNSVTKTKTGIELIPNGKPDRQKGAKNMDKLMKTFEQFNKIGMS